MASVSKYKLQEAVNTVAKNGLTKAAIILGIPSSTLSTRLKIADREGIVPDTNTLSEVEAIAAELKSKNNTINILNDRIEQLSSEILDQEHIKKFIFNLKENDVTPPKWTLSSSYKNGDPGIPMGIWSDFHWGEVVHADQVSGVNEYSLAIARARFKKLVSKTISLCKHHIAQPNYPGFILLLGGDMVSGDIHEELEVSNEAPIGIVVRDLVKHLIWGIEQYKQAFGKVRVVGVAGNHGRTHKKPRYKDRQFTNWDWIIYQWVHSYFQNDKDVTFYIPNGTDAQFDVYNTNFLLTHGDNLGVKGGDGIIGLIGPVTRGSFKISNAQSRIGKPYDVLVMGHWHTYMPLPKIIVNGSLKGFDEFAHLALRASPEPPQQALWMVHPEHGITCHWAVICDKLIGGHYNPDAEPFLVTGV